MVQSVGVRSAQEVFSAIAEAGKRPRPRSAYQRGLMVAYWWAAGAPVPAPITRVAAVGAHGPCRAQLLAECQAAAAQLRRAPTAADHSDFALGAFAALAWLSGRHDERP
ncbi:hypothetical protein KCMC57_up05610 [Kitasatospora sp. CMC57]|uniref:Triphosphoribosyl-dephospho-CoA synthase n=2 Tax=Kitasatospora sp. CMC57 TaxID=3231513 RepID=A0AB33JSB0_9ACTN